MKAAQAPLVRKPKTPYTLQLGYLRPKNEEGEEKTAFEGEVGRSS
jgi:hypothetical protein